MNLDHPLNLDHPFERRYCPLHPSLLQPGDSQCAKCGLPLLVDASMAGALRQLVQQRGMLYIMLAIICALLLAIPLIAR